MRKALKNLYDLTQEQKEEVNAIQVTLENKNNILNNTLTELALEIENKFVFNHDILSILLNNKIMDYEAIDKKFRLIGKESFLDFVQSQLSNKGLFLSNYSPKLTKNASLNTSFKAIKNQGSFLNSSELKLVFSVLNNDKINIYAGLSKDNPSYGFISKENNTIKLVLKSKLLKTYTEDSLPYGRNSELSFIDFKNEKEFLNFWGNLKT